MEKESVSTELAFVFLVGMASTASSVTAESGTGFLSFVWREIIQVYMYFLTLYGSQVVSVVCLAGFLNWGRL